MDMDRLILEELEALVTDADKIIGVNQNGVMHPVANYAVLIMPLCEYILKLEDRIKALEGDPN